ncbi:ECF-type riboflavin transporter substrate-binding protein [Nicoliella spurrieriana]|uniref:UPF0397 protein MOO44_04160 n=1 Tax=Nicoliella spurrieriana TaxID=2925830 RepID=A0A976RTG4_9LACO|nr:ECF-type riboflavin transporter substrate-binding protein [Nicoliella spurrieriana]UQS87354.1 ECF-type riboflavin transporter substrate-binding protein [Nicoliella spurrieriana]
MNRKHLSIRTVVAIGIGTAIVFLLKRWVSIPSGVPNTNIDTSYGFLGFAAVLFGPIAGFCMGFLGHALTDFTMYGMPWWSWVISTGFVGLGMGLLHHHLGVDDGMFTTNKMVIYNVWQILINFIAWTLIAPTGDILIYAEPANKVFLQGFVSTITNSLSTGVIGTILLASYAATKLKRGSLRKED